MKYWKLNSIKYYNTILNDSPIVKLITKSYLEKIQKLIELNKYGK